MMVLIGCERLPTIPEPLYNSKSGATPLRPGHVEKKKIKTAS